MHRLHLYHPRRSGGHIVGHWLLAQEYGLRDSWQSWRDEGLWCNDVGHVPEQRSPVPSGCSWQLVTHEDSPVLETSDRVVVLLRSPWNWVASCFHAGRRDTRPNWEIWIDMARTARQRDDVVLVLFDHWVRSEEVRESLRTELPLPEGGDKALSHVPGAGGGSSVDKTRLDGCGQDMAVTSRYVGVEAQVRRYLQHAPELLSEAEDLFGRCPEEVRP